VISDALLDSLRALAETGLDMTCDVARYVETNTPDGTSQAWQTVQAGVPCLLSLPSSGGTEAIGGAAQTRALVEWEIWLPAMTDVTVKDRLAVGSRTFEVNAVAAISYEPLRRCNCSEVT
jgi:head-tail adaptor